MNPRVFVSHASEDKDRFVLEFATRLRERGIDAWLDKWEMLPGDSLVDKIFEEGIKDASAVIVVLSKFSVEKPWVKEELNAACVKRINGGSKLIPVVIDDCEVPEVLKSTLWERISDVSSYDESLERIVSSVFGVTDKPPLGSPPAYAQSFVPPIGDLSNMDSLVLRLSCEHALRTGHEFIEPSEALLSGETPAIPEGELSDSLEMLDRGGYIKVTRLIGMAFCPYRVTTFGFRAYAEACIPDYEERIASVVSVIVNEGLVDNDAIRERLNESGMLVDHILSLLRNLGHIRLAELIGGFSRIIDVSPALKRMLRGS
jgi:hypothetical protein